METVQLNNKKQFQDVIEKLCGEANEAAKIASSIFKDDDLAIVLRELARIMEVAEAKILPIAKKQEAP